MDVNVSLDSTSNLSAKSIRNTRASTVLGRRQIQFSGRDMATRLFVRMREAWDSRRACWILCLEGQASASSMWLSGQQSSLGRRARLAYWE
jgi:hypothetical protein